MKLKDIFASDPVLAKWDPERPTILEACSSGYAIGSCLSQIDEQGQIRPVAYFSKGLNGAEVNYPIHDKGMHSIFACLQEWKPELTSVADPFTILSDHKNLEYFRTKRLLNERQVRYNDVLQQFRYKFEWRPGKNCERPDALSRRDQDKPVGCDDERTMGRVIQLLPSAQAHPAILVPDGNENIPDEDDPATSAKLFEDDGMQALWKIGVESDNDWRRARNAVRAGERGFPADLAYKLSANIAECTVAADGILKGRENRIWVPNYEPLRTSILQRTHDSQLAGHPGKDGMVGMILRR
ncbi:hypothetical protein K3495_g649 [Podosphaera aphanis]|nr:hypothetical protein K3495_g649 [Podosphaera aphanis]